MSRRKLPRAVKKGVQIQIRLTPGMASQLRKRVGEGHVATWIRNLIDRELNGLTSVNP
jgi:hypothetical protein